MDALGSMDNSLHSGASSPSERSNFSNSKDDGGSVASHGRMEKVFFNNFRVAVFNSIRNYQIILSNFHY